MNADIFLSLEKNAIGRKRIIELFTIESAERHDWQDIPTPYNICHKMCELVAGKATHYVILFNLEFLEVLVMKFKVNPKNIIFFGCTQAELDFANCLYGVHTSDLYMTEDRALQVLACSADDIKTFRKDMK